MNTKRLAHVEIKSEDRGEVEAVFSTFNVVDSDGDVTHPDAFEAGVVVPISAYGHQSWAGALPVGKGRIRVTGSEAVLDGKFFLDTTTGRDTFQTVKALAAEGLGEWSYGYDVLDSDRGDFDGQPVRFLKRLKVNEVSPVLVGAGVNTRTLAVKGADRQEGTVPDPTVVEYKAAIRPHSSAVTARPWDAAGVVAGIPAEASVTDLRTVYAWVDSNGDPEAKGSYRFPHHHGVGGPANVRALIAGIAALNGARGGTAVPEADRKGIYNHLAGHLRDADREPPELRSAEDRHLKLHEEAIKALAGVDDYLASAERVAALRAEKGKALSQINLEALEWVGEDLRRVLTKHAELVRRLRDTPREAAAVEFARFLHHQRQSV